MSLSAEVLEKRLRRAVPDADSETVALVMNWNDADPYERGLFTLKGPILSTTVHQLHELLASKRFDVGKIRNTFESVDAILNDHDAVLTRSVLVGCGCLHT